MMKSILFALALLSAASAHPATLVTLRAGETNSVPAGRVLAIEAVTVNAAQSVSLTGVQSVTEITNAQRIVAHPATNYVVCASNVVSAATNLVAYSAPVWSQMAWPDQRIVWVSTNDVSFAVTNRWLAPGQTHTVTTNLFTGSASGHRLYAVPSSLYLLGGFVTGTMGASDFVNILIGE